MSGAESGTELATLRLPVEAGKVAELNRALRGDPAAVPPTFTVVAAHHTPIGQSANELIIGAAGLDPARVLLGEMAWEYHTPPRVGEVLEGVVRHEETRVREGGRGGRLTLATGTTTWRAADGTTRQTCRVTLIEPAASQAPAPAEPSTEPAAADHETWRFSRTDIVRYAGASGDFNPVHHDDAVARALGYPQVFVMGLLPGGMLACRAQRQLGPLTHLEIRFLGIVWPDRDYALRADASRGLLSLVEGERTLVRAAFRGGN
jgi:acyl dehydratase